MIDVFKTLTDITVWVFPIASMLGLGLSYTFRQIVGPLRRPGLVIRALVANFVLVPLLALGTSRLLDLAPSLSAGLMLVATAAGAPFLINLVRAASVDTKLSATLLVLLMPLSVVYMPLVVPLVVAADARVSAMTIAVPLILTLLVPLLVGFGIDSVRPRLAERLRPASFKIASISLLLLVASTLVLSAPRFLDLLGTGAVTAAFVITIGAFAVGYLLGGSGFDRRGVLGLGTGQRNVGAALVVASVDFDDPDTLVMVVFISVVGLAVLFPAAWILRRYSPRTQPSTTEQAPVPGLIRAGRASPRPATPNEADRAAQPSAAHSQRLHTDGSDTRADSQR